MGIGVGIGDVIDTFSHLHTPIEVSLLRVVNGLIVGAIIGALLIWIYRRRAARAVVSARVLVSGYYGFGNLGDEALLEVIVRRCAAHASGGADRSALGDAEANRIFPES